MSSPAALPSQDAKDSQPIWRDRDFLLYSLGNAISFMGSWAQRIGIGWLSWELTKSPTWVGAISLVQYLPLIVLGPFFGVLLDRHDRRGYALLVNGSAAVLALALYALTALHWITIHLLLVMALLLGVVNSAYQTARLTLINDLVRPQLLSQAIAINSILFNLSRALGPAAAGILIASQGIAATFAANAVSFLAILGALVVIDLRAATNRGVSRKGVLHESREGLAYASTHPVIRQLLILSAITALLARGALELLPAFAAAVFHRGSTALAELNTAVGVGAIAGALLLSRLDTAHLARITRFAALGLGLILAVFGASSSYTAGLLILVLFGSLVVLCSVGLQTLLQSALEERYRGRVLGLWSSVNTAGPGVGAALLGALAKPAGLMPVTVVSGLLCAVLVFSVIGRGRWRFL